MLKESSYRSLFNLKGAKNLIFYGYLGRAPYAMLQVGMVIFGNFKTDSYAVGGAMAAGFSISNALIQPVNGRLVDKLGQKIVVSYLLAGFILSSLLITIGEFEKDIIYIIFSVMLGITVPNIGAYTRRNWKVITEEKDNQKVQAIESSIDELNFLVGPSVFATVSNYLNPIIALYIAIVSSVIGTIGVVYSKTIEIKTSSKSKVKKNSIWISKNKLTLLTTLIFVGAFLSSISVYVVAKEDLENIKNLTAFYYLINGSTALLSALFYGYYFSNTKSLRNYNFVFLYLALSVSAFYFANSIEAILLVAFLCGLGIGPIFLLANSYVSNVTRSDILTEAYSWLASSVGFGLALGSSLFGVIIDSFSLDVAKNLFLIFTITPLMLIPFNKGWNTNEESEL